MGMNIIWCPSKQSTVIEQISYTTESLEHEPLNCFNRFLITK